MSESTCHETRPRLAELVDDLLPTAEAATARAHLAECQACRASYARYARQAAAIGRTLDRAPWLPMGDHVRARLSGQPRRSWFGQLWNSTRAVGHAVQVAALVLLVVGGLAFLLRNGPGRELDTAARGTLEGASAPASPAEAPQPAPARSFLLPELVLALGSLDPSEPGGLLAFELPSGRTLGRNTDIRRQGGGLAVSPDGRRAYLLDGPFFHELELPSLRELRSAGLSNPINILGTGRVVAVSSDGGSVYVETWHQTGPTRTDPQLRVGQPEGDYGIAIFDVAQGAFVREIRLEPPWCGVAELFPLPDGRIAVLCGTAHQVRLLDIGTGRQLASVGVSGELGALSPDGRRLWVVTSSGRIQEVDLGRPTLARDVALIDDIGQCAPCVSLRRLHVSADGSRLFVPAAPGRSDLRATGQATVVWLVDTTTLRRIGEVPLPTPAFDAAPTPDGRALLVSNTSTQDPNARVTRLLEVPSGRELAHWAGSVVGLQIASLPGAATAAAPAPTATGIAADASSPDRLPTRAPVPATPLVAAPQAALTSSTPTPDSGLRPTPAPASAGAEAEAKAVLEPFMQARLRRDDRVVLDLLTEELRAKLGGITGTLTQLSNPCWYRYQVLRIERPTAEHLTVQVRVFMHWWSGDNAGSLPQSRDQEIGFVRTPGGWRVDRLSDWQNPRDEPGEPHGWTRSACMGSPLWAARQVPAAPTALPERSAAARQRALEAVRLFARAAGVRTDAGDVEYVGTSRSASAPNRAVERYAQAASPFDVDPSSDTVVAFARGGTAQPELVGSPLTDAELEQRARTFIAQVAPGLDLARLVPNHSAKPSTLPGAALTSYAFRWEDRSGSRTARCATEGQPCSDPGQDAFVEVVLSRAGEVLWYTNTLAGGTSRAPAVPTTGAGG